MKKQLALTIVACLMFAAGVVGSTLALMTSTATVGSNTFTSGSVIIATDHPSTAIVSFSGMVPGDSVGANALVVSNTGSVQLRYALSSSATNTDTLALKDALTLTVKTIDVTTPGVPCDNFDGTQLYTGDLDSTNGKLVGDAAQGAQTGDRVLAAAASETLCFKVSFPSSATGPSGAATTATFTFTAEQTGNNP
jgi:predicted ribosomally synthesized peptide with SipW-like signal peptide